MRLFIGIRLDDNARKEAYSVQRELAKKTSNIKWVEYENLHITLKFLGKVEKEDRLNQIKKVMDGLVFVLPSFNVTLAQAGCFPNKRVPRVLWVDIKDKIPLLKIIDYLQENLVSTGFVKEKRTPHPHITIGRVNKKSKFSKCISQELDKCKVLEVQMPVDQISLFESELSQKGPIYQEIYRINLKD